MRPLEPQVFDLLRYLIENRERVVSRDDIFAAVWHGRIVSDAVLSTRLNAVRAAIGDNGREQHLIRTLPKQGVRFVGDVHETDNATTRRAHFITVSRRLALSLPDAPALAVMAFAALSGATGAALLAGILTEEIIGALCQQDWLLVIAGNQFAGAKTPAAFHQAGRDLRARYVLEGSMRPVGTRTRVVARLVEAQSGCHLWAKSFDVAATDDIAQAAVMKISAQVADAIFAAEALRSKFRSTPSVGVWGCIIATLALINTREKANVDAAEQLLRKAVAADPRCAPLCALLSFVVTLRVHLGWRSRVESRAQALAFARQAINADDDDAWAHLALGYATLQTCNRSDEAIEMLQHALALNPNLSMGHYLIALASAYTGDTATAFAHANLAEDLHPHDLMARGNAGAYDIVRSTTCFVAGRHHDGIAHARKALAANPRQVPAYRQIVTNAGLAGEVEQAQVALRAIRRLAPDNNRFIQESATAWRDPHTYRRYRDAFRIAGSS